MLYGTQIDLNDYYYYYHVVDKQGFAPASRALNIPKSRLSRHIRQLEQRLETRLIQRSSRQFTVTDAGKEFFHHSKAVVEEISAAESRIKQRQQELKGKVRLTCSVGVAQFALENLIADFIAAHPKVEIGQMVTNEPVNLIEQGIDIAIRGHVANLPDSSLIQRKIADVEWRLFASPRYLADQGELKKPEDLTTHKGICLGWNRNIAEWALRSKDGHTFTSQFNPRLSSDDMFTLKNASAAGLGIVSLPTYVCQADVNAGRLEVVLPNWTSGEATLTLLQPTRRGILPAVKALADHISEQLPRMVSVDR